MIDENGVVSQRGQYEILETVRKVIERDTTIAGGSVHKRLIDYICVDEQKLTQHQLSERSMD